MCSLTARQSSIITKIANAARDANFMPHIPDFYEGIPHMVIDAALDFFVQSRQTESAL